LPFFFVERGIRRRKLFWKVDSSDGRLLLHQ
jgi:hypothetical protein